MTLPPRPPRLVALLLVATALAACARSPGAPSGTPSAAPSGAGVLAPAVVPAGSPEVAALASDDFVTRSHAAERLVARGEAALEPLGRAGFLRVPVPGGVSVSATRPVVRAILADLDTGAVRTHLTSPWPIVRVEAAESLGARGGWSNIPPLLARLEDEHAAVRAAAVAALRRTTNRFFDFDAHAAPRARIVAAERWRRWWRVEGRLEARRRDRESG